MRLTRLTTAGLALAGLAAAPLQVQALTLEEAVQAAVIYHPQIQRDEALERAADHAIEEAYSRYLPRLDAEAATGYEVTSSPVTRGAGRGTVDEIRSESSITLQQLVTDGGATPGLVAAARANRRGAVGDLKETSELIAIDTVQLYLNILRDMDFVARGEENVREHEELNDLVSGLVEAGRGSEADSAQSQSRLALAQATLEELRGGLREVTSRFIEITGQDPRDLSVPAFPEDYSEPVSIDEALANAIDGNPSIEATAARVDQTQHEIRVARSSYYPQVNLEAFATANENLNGTKGFDGDINARARATWNIFNGFGDLARVRRAEMLHNAQNGTFDDESRRIREETRVVWDSLVTARDRVVPLREHVGAQRRVFAAYRGQFDVGRRTLLDLLDAQNELFQAELQLIDAEFNVDVAEYELVFVQGQLLKALGVVVPSEEDFHNQRGETAEGS